MRRIASALVRKPALWLTVAFFFPWTWFFYKQVTPPPQFIAFTGAEYGWEEMVFRPSGWWASVDDVSDDGSQVTIGVHKGGVRWVDTKLQLWDVHSGTNITPHLWMDEDWSSLLAGGPMSDDTGVRRLLSQPTGRELLQDEQAWADLKRRLQRRQDRHREPSKFSELFPRTGYVSSDGKYFAYQTELWFPVYGVAETLGKCMVVEEFRTGKNVALLPSVPDWIVISPDGKTAVTRNFCFRLKGDQPNIYFWDLRTSSFRNTLLLPDEYPSANYSNDGRFVFSRYSIWGDSTTSLRWWDAESGKQVGTIENVSDWTVMDKGRVLVTHPRIDIKNGGSRESYRLKFWDAITCSAIGEWDLGSRSDKGGSIDKLMSCENGRYLAGEYDPDTAVGRSAAGRIEDRMSRFFGGDKRREHKEILLWDVIDRSEVARFPGRSARFSHDGKWLATIDDRGILRVWELPLHRPWTRILICSLIASLLSLVAARLLIRTTKRVWSGRRGLLVRQGFAWLGGSPPRRAVTIGLISLVVMFFGALLWYSFAAARARAEMEDVYDNIGNDTTEADITAMVGTPPQDGESDGVHGPFKGGGEIVDNPRKRKWVRFGTEMEVQFGEDGKAKASYISNPRPFLHRVVDWIGW